MCLPVHWYKLGTHRNGCHLSDLALASELEAWCALVIYVLKVYNIQSLRPYMFPIRSSTFQLQLSNLPERLCHFTNSIRCHTDRI